MGSDTNLHRRVKRLENETESVYALITEMRSTQLVHGERLDEMQVTLAGMQAGLAEVLRRLPDAS
jgi:hypothetical protein